MYCRLCESSIDFAFFGALPVGRLVASRQFAMTSQRHPISLGQCRHCGLVQLKEPVKYLYEYDSRSLPSAAKRCDHMADQVASIASVIGRMKKPVVLEIGSNDGTFLKAVKHSVPKSVVVGIDPYPGATINGMFDERSVDEYLGIHPCCDVLVMRHVLEHVDDLVVFSSLIDRVTKRGTFVLVEVPWFDAAMESLDYSAIWEEHCNYFGIESLTWFAKSIGLLKNQFRSRLYCGESLQLTGFVGQSKSTKRSRVNLAPFSLFVENIDKFGKAWRQIVSCGPMVKVVYGAGCRAATLLNLFGAGEVEKLVDDNINKQGLWLPGCGLRVVSPDNIDSGCFAFVSVNEQCNEVRDRLKRHGISSMSINPPNDTIPQWWKAMANRKASK